ncbi:Hypothetical predicted protein [Mytilus galloprovincialis]|uniref:SRCR domain-containing protein n=1 Tax=Mytilus galloprovincialis TaxID=29158 RepID=A0A8B6CLD4_MYTGA|nr:Hypothetical predicted protein [Mytilus galloprovincialis]
MIKWLKDNTWSDFESKESQMSISNEGLKDNVLYEGSETEGLKVNILYQSAGPDSVNQGPNAEYAEVLKPHKNTNKTSNDEYAVVQKQNDVYAEVDKKAQQKNVKKKKQKDKKKPLKSGKTKGGAQNNNLDGKDSNSGIPVGNMSDGAYSNAENQSAGNKIVFNGIDGDSFQGDIALDHIMLFSGECDNSSVPVNKSSIFSPSVRLVGGQTNATGRLEIQPKQIGYFSPVCASYWDQYDTKVACRQLGYNNSRMYTKSEYGKGRSERPKFSYQFYCDGSERNLSSCASATVYCNSFSEKVAIDCSNTECFENEYSCGDTDVTCIPNDLLCDGNVDCSNLADEQNCASCGSGQFQCSNHECVPLINRCDGTPQCFDGSDEFRCVKKDDNGQISVYREGAWTLMCYTDDQILAEYLCSITGWGPYSSYSAGVSITDGFLAQPGSSPHSVITNYLLHNQTSCNALTVQCGDIECGVPSVSSTPAGSYVLYGNDAVPGEWPWQALFFMDGSSGCGATLIDPYYAITAAHCVV